MVLTDITHLDMIYLCSNMRENDRTEIFALRPHDSPDMLAWEAYHAIRNTGRGRIAWHKGRPAGVAAFTEQWPGCWEVWMFGTDEFRSVVIDLVRWFRKEANDILNVCEGRRLQCDSRLGYDEAWKLIQAMGGVPEGPPMMAYGKDGAAYQRFVWLRDSESARVLDPHYTRAA